jgi:hypothetical protein
MRAESEAKGELIEDVARILGRAGFLNGAARNMKLGGGNRSSKGYVLDFARNYVAFQVVFADSTWGAEGLLVCTLLVQ